MKQIFKNVPKHKRCEGVRIYIRGITMEVERPPFDENAIVACAAKLAGELIETRLEELTDAVKRGSRGIMVGCIGRVNFDVSTDEVELTSAIDVAIHSTSYLSLKHIAA